MEKKVRIKVKVAPEAEARLKKLCEATGRSNGEMLEIILVNSGDFLFRNLLWQCMELHPSQEEKVCNAVVATKAGSRHSYMISSSIRDGLKKAVSLSAFNMGEIITLAISHCEQIHQLNKVDDDARKEAVDTCLKGILLAQRRFSDEIEAMRSRWDEILSLYFTPEVSPAYQELKMFFDGLSGFEAYGSNLVASKDCCRRDARSRNAEHTRGVAWSDIEADHNACHGFR
ncbi:hypothetical protein SYK_31330 [Pseudodesulfovibrio nedwellii]|uniref:Uncharacterized protein n=1 Tax=Pseudodesulfovibrio nedwellii TaxID=2973072 RepID=A0ABM8B4L6_9BACT|nr:hypothetical protein [Pseudodesulfovibrio nedwellii]BDQ38773.1 hypothetical protein SYK_31330 [Pseudodesulfovibrio nedwellii]